MPKKVKSRLYESMRRTKKCNKILINLAINYGSKNEIIEAFSKIKKKGSHLTINNIENNLYTKKIKDPDILIRTGGKKRLSNFLLWQIAYSEIYFIDKLWPDFNTHDFNKILKHFKKVKRNFGNI